MSTDFTDMGRGKTQKKYLYTFIHNVYADFFSDMMNYFADHVYPRFGHRVMGTYDKAVEYLTKKAQYDREMDMPMKPAIILNPTGEFNIAEGNAGGKQYWRFPNLTPGFATRLFDPVYQDDHVKITPGFMRIKGEVELIMLLESFYEYCDIRMLFLNIFGGTDRIIEPQFFNSFIILPEDLVNYEYYNEYTGTRYTLDWDTAGAYETLVRTTNRNELVIPVNIKPQISLVGISDASERYGGTDSLPSWKLNATINYEIELPVWLLMETDYLAQNINLEVRYGTAFSEYPVTDPPVNRQLYKYKWDWGLNEQTNSDLNLVDSTSCFPYLADFVLKTRYYHVVTQSEIDSTGDLVITLPETITDNRALIVNSKYGSMAYGDNYEIINSGTQIIIYKDNVQLVKNMVIELYIYDELGAIV